MARYQLTTIVLLCSLIAGSLVANLVLAEPPIHPDEGLKHLAWQDFASCGW